MTTKEFCERVFQDQELAYKTYFENDYATVIKTLSEREGINLDPKDTKQVKAALYEQNLFIELKETYDTNGKIHPEAEERLIRKVAYKQTLKKYPDFDPKYCL